MEKVRILGPLHTKALSRWPGDTARQVTRTAYATDGRALPRGSWLQPLSFGHDNVSGSDYHDVTVLIWKKV